MIDGFLPLFESSSLYNEAEYLVALRYKKYCSVRKELDLIFQKAEKAWKLPTFKNISEFFVNSNEKTVTNGNATLEVNLNPSTESYPSQTLDVAFFHVSMEHHETAKLSNQLKDHFAQTTFQEDFIVSISCQKFKSLKGIIAHIVAEFFQQFDTDSNARSTCSGSSPSASSAPDLYTLDTILQEWSDEMPQIFILMDSIEAIKRDLLNDFFSYLV